MVNDQYTSFRYNEDERKGNRNWNGLNLEKQTVNFEK